MVYVLATQTDLSRSSTGKNWISCLMPGDPRLVRPYRKHSVDSLWRDLRSYLTHNSLPANRGDPSSSPQTGLWPRAMTRTEFLSSCDQEGWCLQQWRRTWSHHSCARSGFRSVDRHALNTLPLSTKTQTNDVEQSTRTGDTTEWSQ